MQSCAVLCPLVSSSLLNANLLSGVGEEIQETQSGGAACEDWGVWRDLFITSLNPDRGPSGEKQFVI